MCSNNSRVYQLNNLRNLFSNNSRTSVQIIRAYINQIIRAYINQIIRAYINKIIRANLQKIFYSNSRPRIIRARLIIRAFKVEKKLNSRAQYSSN